MECEINGATVRGSEQEIVNFLQLIMPKIFVGEKEKAAFAPKIRKAYKKQRVSYKGFIGISLDKFLRNLVKESPQMTNEEVREVLISKGIPKELLGYKKMLTVKGKWREVKRLAGVVTEEALPRINYKDYLGMGIHEFLKKILVEAPATPFANIRAILVSRGVPDELLSETKMSGIKFQWTMISKEIEEQKR